MAEEKNNSELIREALGSGVTKPKEIVQWVQDNYGREVSTALIGQVKNKFQKKQQDVLDREPATRAPATTQVRQAVAQTNSSPAPTELTRGGEPVEVDDLLILKHLHNKMGRDGIAKAITLFE